MKAPDWPDCPCGALIPTGLGFETHEEPGVASGLYCNAGCARDHAVSKFIPYVEEALETEQDLWETLFQTQYARIEPRVRRLVSRKWTK